MQYAPRSFLVSNPWSSGSLANQPKGVFQYYVRFQVWIVVSKVIAPILDLGRSGFSMPDFVLTNYPQNPGNLPEFSEADAKRPQGSTIPTPSEIQFTNSSFQESVYNEWHRPASISPVKSPQTPPPGTVVPTMSRAQDQMRQRNAVRTVY